MAHRQQRCVVCCGTGIVRVEGMLLRLCFIIICWFTSRSLLIRAYAGGCVEHVFLLFSSVCSFFDRPVGVCTSVNGRLSVVFFLSTYLFVVTTWNAYGRCTKDCILTLDYRKWGGKARGWSPHGDVHDDLWRSDRFTKKPATKHHKERGWSLCWQRRGWPGSGFT